MICISLGRLGFDQCQKVLQQADLAELRFDLLEFTGHQLEQLFAGPAGIIAACRPQGENRQKQEMILKTAIDCGARYIDLETEAPEGFLQKMIAYARQRSCGVIISYHNFDFTPDDTVLEYFLTECAAWDPDIIKIACKANSQKDCYRILALYSLGQKIAVNKKIIAIGMGDLGRITRLAAPYCGAPFTYASAGPELETAPGQIDSATFKHIYKILDKKT